MISIWGTGFRQIRTYKVGKVMPTRAWIVSYWTLSGLPLCGKSSRAPIAGLRRGISFESSDDHGSSSWANCGSTFRQLSESFLDEVTCASKSSKCCLQLIFGESEVGRTYRANGVAQVGSVLWGAMTQMAIKGPRRVGPPASCTHGKSRLRRRRDGVIPYMARSPLLQLVHERVRFARAPARIRIRAATVS